MADPIKQRKWRNSGRTFVRSPQALEPKGRPLVGAAVTIHFSEDETATLDAIALQIYRENPHDPRSGIVSGVTPSRACALRALIYEARKDAAGPSLRKKLRLLRGALSDFWVREASWRRVTENSRSIETATPPTLPPALR